MDGCEGRVIFLPSLRPSLYHFQQVIQNINPNHHPSPQRNETPMQTHTHESDTGTNETSSDDTDTDGLDMANMPAAFKRMLGIVDPVNTLTADESAHLKETAQGWLDNMAEGSAGEAQNRDIFGMISGFVRAQYAADGKVTETGGVHGYGTTDPDESYIIGAFIATAKHLFGQTVALVDQASVYAEEAGKPVPTITLSAEIIERFTAACDKIGLTVTIANKA